MAEVKTAQRQARSEWHYHPDLPIGNQYQRLVFSSSWRWLVGIFINLLSQLVVSFHLALRRKFTFVIC